MKERILTGWTFMRAVYAIMGVVIIVQSVMSHQYIIAIFGVYFASMGIFAFGCAAGNCYVPNTNTKRNVRGAANVQDAEFEEMK